jgi:magnesium transporter
VIQVILHTDKHGLHTEVEIDALSDVLGKNEATVWVDVADPTPAEIARLGEEFGFHPLSLEDTLRGGQRPKIEQYDGYQYIAFYGLETVDGRPVPHQVSIFLGKHYLVTVHSSALRAIAETAARWRANVASMGGRGAGFLLYSVLDALVDGYFPVLDDVGERAEALEEAIIQGQPAQQAEILQLRRDLLIIRRLAGPERDVLNVLIRRDPPMFDRQEIVYFQDVYDHLLRISDSVDIYRDVLSSVLDANLTMVSHTLNVVVKRLTAASIILMSIAVVAGIYGMNFVHMPELDWRFGYPFALGLMATVGLVEFAIFRRIGWL